jgi:hypothetical protein
MQNYEIPFRAVQPHQQQMFGEELPSAGDGEQPGPTRRKRQPSMSETMPLYTLCKEDLESMDKEVSMPHPGQAVGIYAPGVCGVSARVSWNQHLASGTRNPACVDVCHKPAPKL